MSDNRRVILLLVFGALSALPISPRSAHAQPVERADTTWAALDVATAINGALDESAESGQLREKAVRRISECSLMYGGLSTLATNAEVKKSYVQAQTATMEVEAKISQPLQQERRLELEGNARTSVALMLRAMKAQGDKEIGPLLRNCRALNDLKQVKSALRELP